MVAPPAREHGLGYLIATVVLGGLFQVVLGSLGIARLMRFVPRNVMVGFVNSLAILIFVAQVPELIDVPWPVYPSRSSASTNTAPPCTAGSPGSWPPATDEPPG